MIRVRSLLAILMIAVHPAQPDSGVAPYLLAQPTTLFSQSGLTPKSSDDPEAVARRYILSRSTVNLADYRLVDRSRSHGEGIEHLTFVPTLHGVPFFMLHIRVHVDSQGRVIRYAAPRSLPTPKTVSFKVTPYAAAQAASGESGIQIGRTGIHARLGAPTAGVHEFRFMDDNGSLHVSKTWHASSRSVARAAWAVYTDRHPHSTTLRVIDANTGGLLFAYPPAGDSVAIAHRAPPSHPPTPTLCGPNLMPRSHADVAPHLRPVYQWLTRFAVREAPLPTGTPNSLSYPNEDDFHVLAAPSDGLFAADSFWVPPRGFPIRIRQRPCESTPAEGPIMNDIHQYLLAVVARTIAGPFDTLRPTLHEYRTMTDGWVSVLAEAYVDAYPSVAMPRPPSPMVNVDLRTFGWIGAERHIFSPHVQRPDALRLTHPESRIWSDTLSQLRDLLDEDTFGTVIAASLRMAEPSDTILQARDVLLYNLSLSPSHSRHLCEAWNVFAARGMGMSAAINPVDSVQPPGHMLSVFEAFDTPRICRVNPEDTLEPRVHIVSAGEAAWVPYGTTQLEQETTDSESPVWKLTGSHSGASTPDPAVAASMTSPPYDLRDYSAAVFEWAQHLRSTESPRTSLPSPCDHPSYPARLLISVDHGANWQTLTTNSRDSDQTTWDSYRVNLRRFTGNIVHLRFQVASPTETCGAAATLYVARMRAVGWRSATGAVDSQEFGRPGDRHVSAEAAPAVELETPIASWPMEELGQAEGTLIRDGTAAGRDGYTEGFGSTAVRGAAGYGRVFNGLTDGVVVEADTVFSPEHLTVRAWVKVLAWPSSFGVIVSQFGGANAKGWYLAVTSTGKIVLMGATPPSSMPWMVSNISLKLGRWHHVVGTLDRATGNASIYVDGDLDRTATFPGVSPDPTSDLHLARASWTNSYHLNAVLDDVALFDGLWNRQDVLIDRDRLTPPPATSNTTVSAHWTFDHSIQDSSGNDHDPIRGDAALVDGIEGYGYPITTASDALEIESTIELNPRSFTLRTWIRLSREPNSWGDILSNYGADYAGWRLGITAESKPFFAVGARPNQLPSVVGTDPIAIGRWTALTAVYSGPERRMSLYVDGSLVAERLSTSMTPRASGVVTIGRASWIEAFHVPATIDEVVIAPHPWTSSQILQDYLSYQSSASLGATTARWKFDEQDTGAGATMTDEGPGRYDILLNGTKHGPQAGVSNAARWLPGWPDFGVIETTTDLSTESFSWSGWIRLNRYPDSWGAIFGNHDGMQSGWYTGVYRDGRIILMVAGPTSKPWLLSEAQVTLDRWHHVGVTFEGNSRRGRIYLDGTLVASARFPSWSASTTATPTLGRASWGSTGWLSFSIDEARFDDYERLAEDMRVDYELLRGAADPAPVAEWTFNEPAGSAKIVDVTGSGHDATVADSQAVAYGESWQFSGRGGAQVVPHPELVSTSFSFSLWARITTMPSRWGVLYSNFNGASSGWYLAVDPPGRVILCVAGGPNHKPWLVTTRALPVDEWSHVAVTFDGVNRSAAIYIDGVRDITAVFPAYSPESEVPTTFAKASWVNSYYLPVALGHAALWGDVRGTEFLRMVADTTRPGNDSPSGEGTLPLDASCSGVGSRQWSRATFRYRPFGMSAGQTAEGVACATSSIPSTYLDRSFGVE